MPLAALPAPRGSLSTPVSVLVARSMSVQICLCPGAQPWGKGWNAPASHRNEWPGLGISSNDNKTTDLFLAVQINSNCSLSLDSAFTCAGNGPSLRKGWGEEQVMCFHNSPQTLPPASHFQSERWVMSGGCGTSPWRCGKYF